MSTSLFKVSVHIVGT